MCPRVTTSHSVLLPWRRRVMLNSHAGALLHHIGWQSAKSHMSEHFRWEFFYFSTYQNSEIYILWGDDAPSKLVQNIGTFPINDISATAQSWKTPFFLQLWAPIAQTLSHKPGCNWIYRMRRFNSYHSLLKMGLYAYIWYTQIDIARDPHCFAHV